MKVHIWIPDYESAMGGIQVFSRFFIRALCDCLPGSEFSVLSKNDNSFPVLPSPGSAGIPADEIARDFGNSPAGMPALPGSGAPRMDFRCAGWWPLSLRTPAFAGQLFIHTLRHRPDLVVTTHVNFSPVASLLKGLAGIPYAVVAHGVDVWGVRRRWLGQALGRADRVLAVSQFTRARMLAELRLDPDAVGVLPNTVDSEHFRPAPKPRYLLKRFGLKPDQPVILTVARLASEERYKGYDQVLRALPAIKRLVPKAHYILGGRGADRCRVEGLVRQLKLADSVTLAGYIPDHELCDFYNLCDVFAMPSKLEGFGIVFLEALACGKPVLAGNKDGSVDALLGGELGVLIDPDDVPQIAQALSAILLGQHPLPILKEPERLRERVIAAYGYERFVQRVAGHLAQLGFGARGSRGNRPQPWERGHPLPKV